MRANKYPKSGNHAAANVDVLGPSVLFNLGETTSIALFTRGRSFGNINDLDGASIQAIEDDTTDDFMIQEDHVNVLAHAWAELGISYAQILLHKKQHVLKTGVSLKYLQGLGGSYAVGEN
ncbi:hypothetical protein KFZ70_10080 [Tamlana fucoidanivorans]|uniref:DUF5723 domain-containing protein n=1 Tax=Allotamlana fucoidanivorans TaxID=2583814 RepID=A0A5C4SP41_9FLAO|nr:hypothetical protein FGF67_05245 [Tamlana fucoidanivorans]